MCQLAIDYSSYFIGPYYLWSLNFREKHKSQSRRIFKILPGYHSFFSLHFPWWGAGALFLQILAKSYKSAVGSKSFGVCIESLGFSVSISLPPFSFYKTVAFSEHTLPANNALSTHRVCHLSGCERGSIVTCLQKYGSVGGDVLFTHCLQVSITKL